MTTYLYRCRTRSRSRSRSKAGSLLEQQHKLCGQKHVYRCESWPTELQMEKRRPTTSAVKRSLSLPPATADQSQSERSVMSESCWILLSKPVLHLKQNSSSPVTSQCHRRDLPTELFLWPKDVKQFINKWFLVVRPQREENHCSKLMLCVPLKGTKGTFDQLIKFSAQKSLSFCSHHRGR